jgi:hypothetical protein
MGVRWDAPASAASPKHCSHAGNAQDAPLAERFAGAGLHAVRIGALLAIPSHGVAAMITQIEGMPAGTLGFSASGQVTADDYERVIVPDIEAAFALSPKLRLLYHLGEAFTGFDAEAMWDDAKLGLRHYSGWERVALVTDVAWLRGAARAMDFVVPGEFRLFANAELEQAKAWIAEAMPLR